MVTNICVCAKYSNYVPILNCALALVRSHLRRHHRCFVTFPCAAITRLQCKQTAGMSTVSSIVN